MNHSKQFVKAIIQMELKGLKQDIVNEKFKKNEKENEGKIVTTAKVVV